MRLVTLAAVALALVLGVAALVFGLEGDHAEAGTAFAVLDLVIGWSFVGGGLVAWLRSPGNRVGPLMVATGMVWLVAAFQLADETALYTLGLLVAALPLALIAHLLVAFPEGRLRTPVARAAADP